MAYFPSSDYTLEVRRGNVPGHTMVSILGHNAVHDTTQTTIAPTLTTADIDQSAIDTTPATVDVASTDNTADVDTTGTGLRSLTLYGLDSSGDEQSETILMNGQTEVTSSNTYSAVTGWEQLTTGSGNANAGTIWVGNGVFTAGVPADKYLVGEIGYNKALTAYYVVPNAKTFYGQRLIANVSTASIGVQFFIQYSADGALWETERVFGLVSGASLVSDLIALPPAVAGTHIRVQAVSSAASTDISVVLSGELVDD